MLDRSFVRDTPTYRDMLRAEHAWNVARAEYGRATFADSRYRTEQTFWRVSRAMRNLRTADARWKAAEDAQLHAVLRLTTCVCRHRDTDHGGPGRQCWHTSGGCHCPCRGFVA